MYYTKMHCSNLNLKILPYLFMEKKILEMFKPKSGNDPLMTFDPKNKIT